VLRDLEVERLVADPRQVVQCFGGMEIETLQKAQGRGDLLDVESGKADGNNVYLVRVGVACFEVNPFGINRKRR
jgi:hypothetical protein